MAKKKASKRAPILSSVDPIAWYNEIVEPQYLGKFSEHFILSKAKTTFGHNFSESRYQEKSDSPEDDLKSKIMNVWKSQE